MNGNSFFSLYGKAVRGFEKKPDTIPINKITYSVVPEENKVTYFEDEAATTCVKSEITVRINAYAPTNLSGARVNSVSELIMDYLADYYIENLVEYSVGDMSYDETVNAILLPCRLHLVYTSCALEETETDLSGSVPDTFFCKSHVNNTDIHLSEDDRLRLSSPYIIGSYTGDGSDEGLTLELDFRPSAVIVYRNSYHISSYSNSDSLSHCYSGIAVGTSYTRGLIILDTGFRVKTVATANATTHLNDEGGAYTYIAFR